MKAWASRDKDGGICLWYGKICPAMDEDSGEYTRLTSDHATNIHDEKVGTSSGLYREAIFAEIRALVIAPGECMPITITFARDNE